MNRRRVWGRPTGACLAETAAARRPAAAEADILALDTPGERTAAAHMVARPVDRPHRGRAAPAEEAHMPVGEAGVGQEQAGAAHRPVAVGKTRAV